MHRNAISHPDESEHPGHLPRSSDYPKSQKKIEIGRQMNRKGLIAYALAGFLFGRSAHY